jgi:hypothetical protein
LLFFFASTFKPKQKKDKEKDKGIPCVMYITNDDATRKCNKHKDLMKKIMLEKEEKKLKKKEIIKKV